MRCQIVFVLLVVAVGVCHVSAYVSSPYPSGSDLGHSQNQVADLVQQLQTALREQRQVRDSLIQALIYAVYTTRRCRKCSGFGIGNG